MKLSIKTLAVLLAGVALYSCNDGANTSSTNTTSLDSVTTKHSSVATDTSTTVMKTATVNAEQEFLNYAVPANTKELMWIKAGINMGTAKNVKEHSRMMLNDHNKMAAEIKKFMSSKAHFTMPTVDTANVVNLTEKKGADWDKAWTNKMVTDHTELLEKLQKSKNDVKDADLNKMITNNIPIVESHLAMVKKLQSNSNK